jgi:hypothetical protein
VINIWDGWSMCSREVLVTLKNLLVALFVSNIRVFFLKKSDDEIMKMHVLMINRFSHTQRYELS